MTDIDDRLDFCKQALGELGTRSTITSLDPPDGSQEAYYCNLFFNGTRDQILRAAHWGFASYTDRAPLWKAAPGTPENPEPAGGSWSQRDPPPKWLYSYVHRNAGILQIQRVREGTEPNRDWLGSAGSFNQYMPFEVAVDQYDRNGNLFGLTRSVATIVISTPGSGYRAGDYITLQGDAASLMGQPVTVQVQAANAAGAVTVAGIHSGGSFLGPDPASLIQTDTTGNGTGFACVPTLAGSEFVQKVILTNARHMIMDHTTNVMPIAQFDPFFGDAMMLALEGKLALALLGDRAIYTAKLQEANNAILQARVRDANEGLTVIDHVPDWLQVRGIASMASPGAWYNPPYGPLFAV